MSSKASETKLKSGILLEDGGLKFDDELWSFAAKLGSGRFASVFRIHCTSAPERVPLAAKVTQLNGISQWARAQLSEELAIWQTLKHPNVVRMYGHMADATRHVLVLELALGGELFERIVKMQSFCEAHAARQIAQVLSAVEYLHSFGVLHRDLKPENLLLESDADDAAVKVADFGASKLVISSGGAKTPCGSLGYAAPEQLKGLKFAQNASVVPTYDREVDLWSVGVITYILLSGSMPFDPSTYSPEALERRNALEFPPSLFLDISGEACDFIRALLQVDPTKRLSAAEALVHPWLLDFAPDASAGSCGAPLLTPGSRLTPLSTPRRLKQLQDSGQLKKAWDRTVEAGPLGRTAIQEVGSECEAAREAAHKRTAEEIDAQLGDVPELVMPSEVSKRLRSGEASSLDDTSRSGGNGAR